MQDQSGEPTDGQSREAVSILLVGFDTETADQLEAASQRKAWRAVAARDDAEALELFVNERFDLVMIEIDRTESYAPHLIRRLRSSGGRSATAPVVAVAPLILPGLGAQITRAGGDIVFPINGEPALEGALLEELMSRLAPPVSGLGDALTKVLSALGAYRAKD
ncbi:hypothetical protein AADZ90_009150 [Aestuariibius sp. 2305UL40-4]|uniref:hypothetical protein n=1 Tax=Aestuariibius violaceus TaxID=3234132 RepID=UPI00345E11CC